MVQKAKYKDVKAELQEISDAAVGDVEKILLSQSDFNFKIFIEQSPNMIFINKEDRIAYVNNRCEDAMGYTREEFLSPQFDFMKLIAPESVELLATNFRLHMNGRKMANDEYVLINRKGEKIDAIITSKLIDYEGQQAILGIVTDITGFKKAEKSLRESEENYHKLISEMCHGFVLNEIIFDQNGIPVDCCFLEVNPAFENITGLSKDDIVGKTVVEVFPGTKSFWVDRCGDVAASGKPVQFKNGSNLFGRFFDVIAYCPQKGKVATIFTDITERVQIENALRESESNFKAIAENANDGILIAGLNDSYVYANRRASEITGYSMPELLTMSCRDLVHPDEIERIGSIYKNRMDGKFSPSCYETLIHRKDDICMPVDVTVAKTIWNGQTVILFAIRDITLRKRFEEALGKINRELESRVEERTTELMEFAEKLEEKQNELLRHKRDLARANKELVQTNTALSVLARNIDKKRDALENKIAQTIAAKIMPLLEEITLQKIPEKTRAKLDVLSAYLNNLIPRSTRYHDIIISLSSSELRVAMMIKNGFTSEEIGRLLHISTHTVKTHRKSIRRKLNIKNKDINLDSYLKLKFGKTATGS